MTPKTRGALNDLISEDRSWSQLHWQHKKALLDEHLVDEHGVATETGLRASDIPLFDMTVMILGTDVKYGKVTLPKGTEILVTDMRRDKKYTVVDGLIIVNNKEQQVRLYSSSRHEFVKRPMPILDNKEL